MRLTFLGKETTGGQSPTLYSTDRDSYVVQGWIVSDANVLTTERSGESALVEVPARLMTYLADDGLPGEIAAPRPPIVRVEDNGNYILQGAAVTDREALAQMDIPPHETCVEVTKDQMRNLVEGR